MSVFIKSIFAGLALTLVVSTDARAETRMATRSINVSYQDLDLSSGAGAETLMRRVKAASRKVCGPAPLLARQIREAIQYRACIDQAVTRAAMEAGNPTVVAVLTGAAGAQTAAR
jgi:UrcA family protein